MEKNGSITNVEVKITLVALICATLRLLLAILSATGVFTPDVGLVPLFLVVLPLAELQTLVRREEESTWQGCQAVLRLAR